MGMRLLIWLGKTLAMVVVIVTITLWLTGLMMTSVIQSVLKEYNIPLQVEPVIYKGVLGYLWGYEAENTSTAEQKNEKTTVTKPAAPVSGADSAINASSTERESDTYETILEEEQPAINALAPIELEEKLEISKNELGIAKGSLTEAEKGRLSQLLIEKIPAEEWQTISLYMEEGLSESELLETQQILALYLNDEEYRELIGILKKY